MLCSSEMGCRDELYICLIFTFIIMTDHCGSLTCSSDSTGTDLSCCSSEFRNWWLVAHLTDLLHHHSILEPQIHRCIGVLCIIVALLHFTSLTCFFATIVIILM